jgi:hypothetical protein
LYLTIVIRKPCQSAGQQDYVRHSRVIPLVIAGQRPDVTRLEPFGSPVAESRSALDGDVRVAVVVEPNSAQNLATLLTLAYVGTTYFREDGGRTCITNEAAVKLRVHPQASVCNQERKMNLMPMHRLEQQL